MSGLTAEVALRPPAGSDLLFGDAGAAAPGPVRRGRTPEPYDFRGPARLSKDRLRLLEALYATVADGLATWLRGRVGGPVGLTLLGVEQLALEDLVALMPTPCAAFVVDVAGQQAAHGVVDFDPELAFFLVDRLLGGSGPPAVQDRPLTSMERQVVRLVVDRAVQELEAAWRGRVPLRLASAGFEALPAALRLEACEAGLLVARIEARVAGLSTSLRLALPRSVLDALPDRPEPPVARRDPLSEREALEAVVCGADVPITVRLPALRLTMRELAGMHVGQTLTTTLPREAEADVLVGERLRFRGRIGRSGDRLAVRLSDAIGSGPDAGSADPMQGETLEPHGKWNAERKRA